MLATLQISISGRGTVAVNFDESSPSGDAAPPVARNDHCPPWRGRSSPFLLDGLTTGRLKATRTELVDALHGHVTAHHRFMLELHLT